MQASQSQTDRYVVPLIHNGRAQAVILIDSNADSRIRQVAEMLVTYVEKSTGAKLRVVTTKDFDAVQGDYKGFARIYIGVIPPEFEKDVAENFVDLDAHGFVILVRDRSIVLIGPTLRGTLHGVNDFLERYVGVRWLFIGPDGEDVPIRSNISIPNEVIREQPAFMYRVVSPFYGGDPYDPQTEIPSESEWAHRNRLQGHYNYPLDFGHNLYTIFPVEKYGKTNPEFYPNATPPTPGDHMRWQPSFTIDETVEVAVEHIKKYFKDHPDKTTFSLGVNDIGGFCEADPNPPTIRGRKAQCSIWTCRTSITSGQTAW